MNLIVDLMMILISIIMTTIDFTDDDDNESLINKCSVNVCLMINLQMAVSKNRGPAPNHPIPTIYQPFAIINQP